MSYLWSRLKAIPVGVFAAIGAALALFTMYLRGRRLEAELAHARLRTEAANAAVASAISEGAAQAHIEAATAHAARADALHDHALKLSTLEPVEQKRIAALPASQVTVELLKLAQRKK